MFHHNFKKVIAFFLVLSIFSVLIFSQLYIVSHLSHKCSGNDCPICAKIQNAEAAIQKIGSMLQTIVCLMVFAYVSSGILSITNQINLFKTPVEMKVRMND
jgi:hypothetical protein